MYDSLIRTSCFVQIRDIECVLVAMPGISSRSTRWRHAQIPTLARLAARDGIACIPSRASRGVPLSPPAAAQWTAFDIAPTWNLLQGCHRLRRHYMSPQMHAGVTIMPVSVRTLHAWRTSPIQCDEISARISVSVDDTVPKVQKQNGSELISFTQMQKSSCIVRMGIASCRKDHCPRRRITAHFLEVM